MRPFTIGDDEIAIYRLGDDVVATSNVCTHAFALLTDGRLDGDIVECPLHGGCFDVRTGKGEGLPIISDLATYPVRIVDGIIEVQHG